MGKEVIVDVKITTKQAQENIDELNKSLMAQEDLIENLESDLRGFEKQLSQTSGKELARRSDLNKKITETKNRLNEEKAGLKQINKERKRANDQLKDASKNTKDYSGVIGILDRQTGGLISSTKDFTGSLSSATKGTKLLKVALLAVPFVLIATAIASISAALTSSEEGQDKFTKFFTQVKVVIGNVTDLFADFGSALLKFFRGDLKGAREEFDKLREGIANFGEETKKEIELAGKLSDKRAKANKLERQLLVDRAKADRKFNELREKAADKENVSIQERIAALKEAGRIEEEITLNEIQAAKLRLEAKVTENSLSKSTKEDLDEEAQLRAKVIELESSRLKKQKTLTAEITTNLREAESERKRIEAEKAAEEREKETKRKEEEANKEKEKKEREAKEKKEQEEKNKLELEEQKRIADSKIEIEKRLLDAKKSAIDQTIALFGAESAAGKAALIAKQVLAAQEMIQEAKKTLTFSTLASSRTGVALSEGTAQTAKIGFPQNIPMLIAYALQAVGIVSAVASAVGKSKSVAASLGGGGSSAATPSFQAAPTPQAPSFNIVGADTQNQLAQTIAQQTSTPVKAFVVAGDVSTAQSLDRNIIQESSLG